MSIYLSQEEFPPSSTLTILLAEDDRDDQELIREAFKEVSDSFSLHIVEDGNSVLEYLNSIDSNQLPCLIILDYNMPEMNGAQVLEKLCGDTRYASIPKVVLSTSNNGKYVKEAAEKGAHAYRIKPSNFTGLVSVVKEMLELCKAA